MGIEHSNVFFCNVQTSVSEQYIGDPRPSRMVRVWMLKR